MYLAKKLTGAKEADLANWEEVKEKIKLEEAEMKDLSDDSFEAESAGEEEEKKEEEKAPKKSKYQSA